MVKSQGITTVLAGSDSRGAAESSVDSSAVKDSVDTLAGIAASSQEGRMVCLESSAGPAACSTLQVHSQLIVRNGRAKSQQLPGLRKQLFGSMQALSL